jgi:hypothetical protein
MRWKKIGRTAIVETPVYCPDSIIGIAITGRVLVSAFDSLTDIVHQAVHCFDGTTEDDDFRMANLLAVPKRVSRTRLRCILRDAVHKPPMLFAAFQHSNFLRA